MNKIELKFDQKIYKVELPDLESFTGQVALIFHCKSGILMEAQVQKKGSIAMNESYAHNQQLQKDTGMV